MSDEGKYICEYATYPSGNEQGITNLVMLGKSKIVFLHFSSWLEKQQMQMLPHSRRLESTGLLIILPNKLIKAAINIKQLQCLYKL